MSLPLLLLPGMMCDARLFSRLTLPGTILHGDISGQGSMTALAASVLAQAPPRFALAGLSMGGIVAMEIARQAPERVARLALMDTNPLAETDAVSARRGPQIERARAGHLDDVMRHEMKPNYLTNGPDRAAILDLCMDMALNLGPDVFIRQSVALRDRPDQCATLCAILVPTLILCGCDDALCPPERHRLMQRLVPGSTLTIVEGAGHLPPLERPDETTAALTRWLDDAVLRP